MVNNMLDAADQSIISSIIVDKEAEKAEAEYLDEMKRLLGK